MTRPAILVFGTPRSGTSWLGRIFDSHPETLYRHEPDTVVKERDLPFVFGPGELERHVATARRYVQRLTEVSAAKCTSHLPQFRKSYRGSVAHAGRLGLIYAQKILETVSRGAAFARNARIPDLVSDPGRVIPVVKSVDSLGRAPLFARAAGDCRVILIIRHPCGMVSSKLRGLKLGTMAKSVAYRDWLKLGPARARGLTAEALASLSPLQTAAYQWLLFNEYVLDELSADPRFFVVVYDDFCRDPHGGARDVFEFCGLDYSPQTRDFIEQSLSYAGPEPRYFQIVRNPLEAANRWRSELSAADQSEIAELVRGSRAGAYFFPDKSPIGDAAARG